LSNHFLTIRGVEDLILLAWI